MARVRLWGVLSGAGRDQLARRWFAGLPAGQMGNSEVGHLNIGAGRVVYQDLVRIDRAIADASMERSPVLIDAFTIAKQAGRKLHIMGLLSDGGVHSMRSHIEALCQMAYRSGVKEILVHAFTDGRDTDPNGGAEYVRQFNERAAEVGVGRIASVIGRYYAMDRDRRWERTKLAYDLLVSGHGDVTSSALDVLRQSYAEGVTDEFVMPKIIDYADGHSSRIEDGDAVIFFNFRADRARQLTQALIDPEFDGFQRPLLDLHLATISPYDASFNVPVAFDKVDLTMTLGEVIEGLGGRQLRVAETEKYAHVTYFFSGGREKPFGGEDRLLVQSPKVPTYDLQPEMSAAEVASRTAAALAEESYNLVVLNFANPDMVGHTGVMEAAVKAVEAVDAATKVVVEAALANGYSVSVIADHGNADRMMNPDGSPHTAHTTVRVPHLIIKDGFNGPIRDGKLGDVAPTILRLLDEEAPEEMTGDVLVGRE